LETPTTTIIPGFAGDAIAVHEVGQGRPLVLLHGLMSSAQVNWIKYGHAARLAEAGFRCIMPDLRAHGQSAVSHDPAHYPADVLALDIEAVIAALGLADFDLAGFSLGARTSALLGQRGLAPRRLILAGMGLQGLTGWTHRRAFFDNALDRFDIAKRGDPDFMAIQFMKTTRVDREAMRLLLTTFVDMDPDALNALTMPTLVLCGDEDRDNGSPHALVEALPDAHLATVPGGHMSCVTRRELGDAMVAFLTA
jgi:pimeloyl-ACP methyl ester carboxylesterase